MKEQEFKDHWRKNYDPNWAGTWVLPNEGTPIDVIITKVVKADDAKVMGQKKDGILIAYFAKNEWFNVPMILNKKNSKRLESLTGHAQPNKWKNVPVTLCQELDRDPTGEVSKIQCLRISKITPKGVVGKVVLEEGTPAWDGAIKWLSEGEKNTVDAIVKKYEVSEELVTKLEEVKLSTNTTKL